MQKNKKKKIIILIVTLLLIIIATLIIFNIKYKNNKIVQNEKEEEKEKVNKQTLTLKLKELTIKENEKYEIKDFVEECLDNKECSYKYSDEVMANYNTEGTYLIEIIANKDGYEETSEKTTLTIIKEEINSEKQNSSESQPKEEQENSKPPQSEVKIPKKVKTIKEEKELNSTIKYGTKITEIETITYDLYDDGSKKKISSKKKNTYDFSGYNATGRDLIPEATENYNKNKKIYNEVLEYTNNIRRKHNLNDLTLSNKLSIAANIRAMEIAYAKKYSHTRPNGEYCTTVINDLYYGQTVINSVIYGENIAYGYKNSLSVVNGWENSPAHLKNILTDGATKSLGVGFYNLDGTNYWVQLIGDGED